MKLNYIDTVPTLIHFVHFYWNGIELQNQAQAWHSQPVLEEKGKECW